MTSHETVRRGSPEPFLKDPRVQGALALVVLLAALIFFGLTWAAFSAYAPPRTEIPHPVAEIPEWDSPVVWTPGPAAPLEVNYRKYLGSKCVWCGCADTSQLEVHHIIPQWMWGDETWTNRPSYGMNDPTNLVTLCDRCHFVVGHRCNYRRGAVTNFWNVLQEANR